MSDFVSSARQGLLVIPEIISNVGLLTLGLIGALFALVIVLLIMLFRRFLHSSIQNFRQDTLKPTLPKENESTTKKLIKRPMEIVAAIIVWMMLYIFLSNVVGVAFIFGGGALGAVLATLLIEALIILLSIRINKRWPLFAVVFFGLSLLWLMLMLYSFTTVDLS